MNAQPQPIATVEDAIAVAQRALSGTLNGSAVILTPRVLQMLLDAAALPAELDGERIRVPLCASFGGDQLGYVDLRADALPPTPAWCIAIGFKATAQPVDTAEGYELVEAVIKTDADYGAYLRQQQGITDG
jgi:hypothetical protein